MNPNAVDIDALVSFLSHLYGEDFNPITEWIGSGVTESGPSPFPYPRYHPILMQFVAEASRDCWIDFNYEPAVVAKWLHDDRSIEHADIPKIKSMLTYFVRGERFADGHWAAMVSNGSIRRILARLSVLRSEYP